MARGIEFSSEEYIVSKMFGAPDIGSGASIAEAVLIKNGIPINFKAGSSLPGYDIKSQDCVTMMRLSLLAGAGGTGLGPEVYCGPDGVARLSRDPAVPVGGESLYSTTLGQYETRMDHVLVKGKQPLPTRYHGGTISIMGKGIAVGFNNMACSYTPSSKNQVLGIEAWAEFESSPNSEKTQNLIKTVAVKRSKWEQLVGFKATFAGIPSYASMSISQVTPRKIGIPFGNVLDSSVSLHLGNSSPDGGGLFDISSIAVVGSPVLSIEKGSDILSSVPEAADSIYPDSYYVLLDNECGLTQLSRGQQWFVQGAGSDTITVVLRSPGADDSLAYEIFYGFDSPGVAFYRRTSSAISSVSDGLRKQVQAEEDEANPQHAGVGSTEFMSADPPRGPMVIGIGSNNVHEVNSIILNYSVTRPSIQIRSPYGNAPAVAAAVAAGGVHYTSIVVQEKPPPTAHATGEACTVVYPKAPSDEDGTPQEVDSEIDELEGTVLDISAPFLGEAGVCTLASIIAQMAQSKATCNTYCYAGGGYNLIPGMGFGGGAILSVEHSYGDKDSITTSVTAGPKYYPVGSYQDSNYIKRSESITRTGLVVGGSNKEGIFAVQVDGRGVYQAILGTIEPVYPGDRVELKIINVPVEKD